jgi:hypothetical protein
MGSYNNKFAISKDALIKIIKEARNENHTDDIKTSAKQGLLRGLDVAPLSQAMVGFLYDKDDVTDEMLEFAVTKDGEDFSYDNVIFHKPHDIVCEYLEKAETQMLSEMLYKRAKNDMEKCIRALKIEMITDKNLKSDTILNRAFKLTIMNEMLLGIGADEINDKNRLQALLTYPFPLQHLFDEWQDYDVGIKDKVMDVVDDITYNLSRQIDYNGIEHEIQDADEQSEGYEP